METINERLKAVLVRLVELKMYRESYGADDYYNRNKKEAWEQANLLYKELNE